MSTLCVSRGKSFTKAKSNGDDLKVYLHFNGKYEIADGHMNSFTESLWPNTLQLPRISLHCYRFYFFKVDSYYCPNCLENMPSAEAKVKKNR